MLLFCKLLAICILDGFMLLMIPRLENAELLSLLMPWCLSDAMMVLCDVLVTLMYYRDL